MADNQVPVIKFGATPEDMTAEDKAALNNLIRPSDSFTADGVYWADLPMSQRFKFITSTDSAGAKAEMSWLWNMFKADPLSPIAYYFQNFVLPGAGLGLEGYVSALLRRGAWMVNGLMRGMQLRSVLHQQRVFAVLCLLPGVLEGQEGLQQEL
jgi:hypothetical protein